MKKVIYPSYALNLYLKSLDKIKTAGPENCSTTLLLLYVTKNSIILEKNINQVNLTNQQNQELSFYLDQ